MAIAETTPVAPRNPARRWWAMVLFVAAAAVYANTLLNGFVQDDVEVITHNSLVNNGISAIPEVITTTYHHGFLSDQADNLYRPLSLVLFAMEHDAFGSDPMPWHATCILLFALCVVTLFFFFDHLFNRKNIAAAFAGALLFALHPIHTEVVANIKSCDELLCFLFAFLSLNIFIQYAATGKVAWLLAGAGCFFLALLSKETAVTFVAVIPLLFFFVKNEHRTRSLHITLTAIGLAGIFLLIRQHVVATNNEGRQMVIDFMDNIFVNPDVSYLSRLATITLIMGKYIKFLLLPYPLISDYSYASIQATNFSDGWVLLSLVVLGAMLATGVYRLLRRRHDVYAFALLYYFITLSIVSNVFFLAGAMMAERFLFLPSAGFCLVAGVLTVKLGGRHFGFVTSALKNIFVSGALLPVCILYAAQTVSRNAEWRDNATLFMSDVKKAPASGKLNRYAGIATMKRLADEPDPATRRQIRTEAIGYLSNALIIYPDFYQVQDEVGSLYYHNEQYPEAIEHERQALRLCPGDTIAINILSKAYFKKQRFDSAILYNRAGLWLSGDKAGYCIRIGACYAYLNDNDSAIAYMQLATRLDPDDNTAYLNLAGIYRKLNQPDSEAKYMQLARAARRQSIPVQ